MSSLEFILLYWVIAIIVGAIVHVWLEPYYAPDDSVFIAGLSGVFWPLFIGVILPTKVLYKGLVKIFSRFRSK